MNSNTEDSQLEFIREHFDLLTEHQQKMARLVFKNKDFLEEDEDAIRGTEKLSE